MTAQDRGADRTGHWPRSASKGNRHHMSGTSSAAGQHVEHQPEHLGDSSEIHASRPHPRSGPGKSSWAMPASSRRTKRIDVVADFEADSHRAESWPGRRAAPPRRAVPAVSRCSRAVRRPRGSGPRPFAGRRQPSRCRRTRCGIRSCCRCSSGSARPRSCAERRCRAARPCARSRASRSSARARSAPSHRAPGRAGRPSGWSRHCPSAR